MPLTESYWVEGLQSQGLGFRVIRGLCRGNKMLYRGNGKSKLLHNARFRNLGRPTEALQNP